MVDEKARIERISLIEVDIPFVTPFSISGGTSRSRKSIIVELESDDIIAYGEAPPFEAPFYSSETIASAKSMLIDWLCLRVYGHEVESIIGLNTSLREGVRGNNFAISGIETAYWDLVAKKNGLRLRDLIVYKLRELGTAKAQLRYEDYVESGASLGIPPGEDLAVLGRWINQTAEEGFRRIKFKIRPGWDDAPLCLARKVLGSGFPIWADANASYELGKHASALKALDEHGCLFLEQPLGREDLLDYARLVGIINTPICVDESLDSLKAARNIIELGFSRIWNIKVHRMGGLWPAINAYKLAVDNGIALWGGTMPESGIGSMCILSLATLSGFKYPADVAMSEKWYGRGTDLKEIEMKPDGRIFLPEGAGIGEINMDNLKRFGRLIWSST